MNQAFFFRRNERLNDDMRPLQVLLNDQTLACFTPEAEKILDISHIARLLGVSKTKSHNSGYKNIPVLLQNTVEKGIVTLVNHSSVLHPSSFFQLVVKTIKLASVSMTRWLTQEILPMIADAKAPLVTVTDDPELKEKIGRHKNGKEGQVLIDLEAIKITDGSKSPELTCKDKLIKGGDDV